MERKQTREQGNAKKCEKRRPLHRSFFCTNERTPLAAFWRLFFFWSNLFFFRPFSFSKKSSLCPFRQRLRGHAEKCHARRRLSFFYSHVLHSLFSLNTHARKNTHTRTHTQKKQTRAHRERRGESKRDASRRTFVSERIKRTQRAQRRARRRKRSRKDFL